MLLAVTGITSLVWVAVLAVKLHPVQAKIRVRTSTKA
jgi:hypothetical protein